MLNQTLSTNPEAKGGQTPSSNFEAVIPYQKNGNFYLCAAGDQTLVARFEDDSPEGDVIFKSTDEDLAKRVMYCYMSCQKLGYAKHFWS